MEKTYNFTGKIVNTCTGSVRAKTVEEARQRILNNDYEEIYDEYDGEITEVLTVEED